MFFNVCSRCLSRFRHLPVRTLLTDCVGRYPRITIQEAQDELYQLIGTSKFWDEERDNSIFRMKLATCQEELPHKTMKDSYRELTIPLGSNELLREKYVNFHNTVRIGRIMEDLDTMAVLIGYSHCAKEKQHISPLSIVTARVDRIALDQGRPLLVDKNPIYLDQHRTIKQDSDIFLHGHVTWVGSSSMEVRMVLEQEDQGKVLDAHFLMVCRDPYNRKKAYVNPLDVTTDEEKTIIEEGAEYRMSREKERQESLLRHPPNEEERELIHKIFLGTLNVKRHTFKARVKPKNSIWMEHTRLKNVIICFPEQRNMYNKIFGGFLMRQAFELGWVNASLHCKNRVYTVAVDDVIFQNPVEVGSLLYLTSQVVYTIGPYMQIKVHAEVVNPDTGEHSTTNMFHYTFATKEVGVPKVIPTSYAEYMTFLDGKRHFERGSKTLSA